MEKKSIGTPRLNAHACFAKPRQKKDIISLAGLALPEQNISRPEPEVFLEALGDVARAKGMTKIAKKQVLGVKAVLKAVGVEMTFKQVS